MTCSKVTNFFTWIFKSVKPAPATSLPEGRELLRGTEYFLTIASLFFLVGVMYFFFSFSLGYLRVLKTSLPEGRELLRGRVKNGNRIFPRYCLSYPFFPGGGSFLFLFFLKSNTIFSL